MPQEAYIGIIYAVASAAMILVLTQVPHGGEETKHLLVGAILWVTWMDVLKTAVLYGVLGLLLWYWRSLCAASPWIPMGPAPRACACAGGTSSST